MLGSLDFRQTIPCWGDLWQAFQQGNDDLHMRAFRFAMFDYYRVEQATSVGLASTKRAGFGAMSAFWSEAIAMHGHGSKPS